MKRLYWFFLIWGTVVSMLVLAATGLADRQKLNQGSVDSIAPTELSAAETEYARDYYWTWYDNQGMKDWVLVANPAASSASLKFNLSVDGNQQDLALYSLSGYETGEVPAGQTLTPRISNLMGGPVKATSLTGDKAIVSQRSLLGNSLEEVLGTDEEKLSDNFFWTWYDEQSPGYKNWILVANPGTDTIRAEIYIDGRPMQNKLSPGSPDYDQNYFIIESGKNATPRFPGEMGGPVEVRTYVDGGSWDNQSDRRQVMASQRVLSDNGQAFNEEPGIPSSELNDHYLWTWYDQQSAGSNDWVLIANPNADPIYYEITVAGQDPGLDSKGLIDSGEMATPQFPGKIGGPVEVRAWTDDSKSTTAKVIASQRVTWGPSFEEMPGYPADSMASEYHWTWYDQQSAGVTNWVLVSNTNQTPVYYEITFAGQDPGPGSRGIIAPGTNTTPTFPGQMNGPVKLSAWTDQTKTTPANVMASQRVLWKGHFNEVPGTVLDPPLPPEIPQTTEVLGGSTSAHLASVSADGITLIFTGTNLELSQVSSLAPGDVIVIDPSPAAPYGLLRKVESVQVGNGQVTLTTSQATLEDAMDQGSIRLDTDQLTAPAAFPAQLGGAVQTSRVGLGTYQISLNRNLYSEGGVTVDAAGSISISPSFDFECDWGLTGIKRVRFVDNTTETSNLSVTASGSIGFDKKWEVWSQTLSPISFAICTVPVWITPVIHVYVGANGQVYSQVTTGVTQQASFTAGLEYDHGNWRTISDFSNNFTWQPPTLSAGADFKAYARPQLDLMIYSVAGPYVFADGYLKLHADVTASPWWTLHGGIDAGAGVKFDVLGHGVHYDHAFKIFEWEIAHAEVSDSSGPTVSNVQPSGTINTTSTSINISYSDIGSGVKTSSVTISLDGNVLSGCTVAATGAQCPVSGLAMGGHTISGSLADNAGNTSPISGGFIVDTSYVTGSGTMLVTLTWDTPTDVDLYVTDPTGDTSWFSDKTTADGGQLDYDNTSGYGPEHWLLQNTDIIRYGQPYVVRVHYYSDHGYTGATNYTVSIKLGEGTPQEQVFWYRGTLTTAGGSYSPGGTGESWANIANVTLQPSSAASYSATPGVAPFPVRNQIEDEAVIIPEDKKWPKS